MIHRTPLSERTLPRYTKGEEIFNSVSHMAGGALGIVATVLCVYKTVMWGDLYGIIGSAIYGVTMILLYAISSIYHALSPRLMAKKVLQVLDHCSIFLLIAGTYTPIALVSLRRYDPRLGWGILAFIWGAAAIGIVLNAIDLKRYSKFSMICYLGMGWCIIATAEAAFLAVGVRGMMFVLLGGIAYTVGALFYGLGRKKRYAHSVFHLFVVLGSLIQFIGILLYVI